MVCEELNIVFPRCGTLENKDVPSIHGSWGAYPAIIGD